MNSAAPLHDKHLDTAADWWSRFQEADPAPEEVAAWLAWMDEDPAHAESFRQVNELAERTRLTHAQNPARLSVLSPLPQMGRGFVQGRTYAAERRMRGSGQGEGELKRRRIHWFVPRNLAIAASVVLCVCSVFILNSIRPPFPSQGAATAIHTTPSATQRDLILPDGSRVSLGGASRIETLYSGNQRLIRLTAGEAYFEVKPDPTRPFVVDTGLATVRALGSAFNIRRNKSRVAITVTEGRVQVTRADTVLQALGTATGLRQPQTTALNRAEQIILESQSKPLQITAADSNRATAWRDGRLEFVDEPLAVVLDNVSRYSPAPIVLADPALGDITYTGTFVPENLDNWLGALEQVFGLEARREAGRIAVRAR